MQVVIEVHTSDKRAAVAELLERRYEVVGERCDVELERCGLSHAIVYARCPRPGAPSSAAAVVTRESVRTETKDEINSTYR